MVCIARKYKYARRQFGNWLGQVAEWLMAADCKSAAPWSYGGSNPPLCTSLRCLRTEVRSQNPEREPGSLQALNRLSIALGVYVLLGVLVWTTLSDEKVRMVTFAILGLFAVKTLLHRKDAMHSSDE